MNRILCTIIVAFLVILPTRIYANDAKWQRIFNGKNLDGWLPKIQGYPLGNNHLNTFIVEDGYLTVSYKNYERFDNKFGHLHYQTKLSQYRLRFSYRFIKQQLPDGPKWAYKNSGVMLHGQDPNTIKLNQSFPVSIEAQLLGADQGKTRTTMNICTPGTNVSINKTPTSTHCVYSNSFSYSGEQWVQVEVEVMGDEIVRHWVNGELVFEYTDLVLDPQEQYVDELITNRNNVALSSGYISLQSESHPIQFKDIELLDYNKAITTN
ncbi:MAG: DUF1080 domain-containing protein [Paraglaciecola sp.]|uniref:3-keto-disaccharide hydrolase n=1 Tax=Paraglaciecola sp. TaxID=1920173 RepID=UPI0032984D14